MKRRVLLLALALGVSLPGCSFQVGNPMGGSSAPPTASTQVVTTPEPAPAGLPHLQITAQVDGRSDLLVANGRLWWQHFDYDAPGRFAGNAVATFLNGEAWSPLWPSSAANTWCGGCESQKLNLTAFGTDAGDGATVAFAKADLSKVFVDCANCTAPVSASYEDGVLAIHFNDDAHGGWSWYVVDIRTS